MKRQQHFRPIPLYEGAQALMRFLKILGWLALAVVLLFAFVVKFSAVESKFECSGEISSKGTSQSSTLFFELSEYRWWVGLWSDSDGSMKLEIPHSTGNFYGHIKEIGSVLVIYDRHYDDQSKKRDELVGRFSTLSKALSLSTPTGTFKGTCRKID